MENKFEDFLKLKGCSENTIRAYVTSVNCYKDTYMFFRKKNLLAYKSYLIGKYKPKTVNLRIQGINSYLQFIKKENIKISQVKIQQKQYLENVISNEDYVFFKNQLLKDKNYKMYFIVRLLTATGARISELVKFKYEHVCAGYIDIYSKSGKIRRIYIPKKLQKEYIEYAEKNNVSSGYLFKNKKDNPVTCRGIAKSLKIIAGRYGINQDVVYPHSFRHRFAKNFLEKYNDIALLADLMGHDSIETTRIYLRKTMAEQKMIVDKYVNW